MNQLRPGLIANLIHRSSLISVICLTLLLIAFRPSSQREIPQFIDVTSSSGIRFLHVNGDSNEKKYLFEAKGAGAAAFDFDNDGWMDIMLVQGSSVERFSRADNLGPVLYHNKRDGTFEDVTVRARLKARQAGWGMGITAGDYDNDGFADIYLTCLGPNLLYHNNGDGTFTDVTEKAGVNDSRWSTSAAFGDYDRDGYLDLYICNYLEMDFKQLPQPGSGPSCSYLGNPIPCGPRGVPTSPDVLFHNNRDGTFTDVTAGAGITEKSRGPGLGAIWADLDNDQDLDLYVANDAEPNYLYLNRSDGTFEEKGLISGLALSGDGRGQASMGVDVADYDNDGRLDVFATHFAADYSTLYHNEGNLLWEDSTLKAQLFKSYGLLVGWGTRFADFNNDGWKDIYHSNGHVYTFLKKGGFREAYAQPGTFFLNQKNGTFLDATSMTGSGIQAPRSSRGVAFADFDNDGDIDFLVSNMDDAPQLFRNDGISSNHWVMFKTNGTKSNRDGIGARIRAVTGEWEQVWEIKRTVGIYSASDSRAHFGLGSHDRVDLLKIRWPSGKDQEFKNVAANTHYLLDEEKGLLREPFARKVQR